jgi:hypothetical protein
MGTAQNIQMEYVRLAAFSWSSLSLHLHSKPAVEWKSQIKWFQMEKEAPNITARGGKNSYSKW